jgi:hypothetical protein
LPWQRAATPYRRAVMVLRWFKEDTDVIAEQAPELPEVLAAGLRQGFRLRLSGRHARSQHPLQRALRGGPRPVVPARAPAERANALLKRTWKALQRVTLDPWRIGAITAAALVLLHLQRPTR